MQTTHKILIGSLLVGMLLLPHVSAEPPLPVSLGESDCERFAAVSAIITLDPNSGSVVPGVFGWKGCKINGVTIQRNSHDSHNYFLYGVSECPPHVSC